MREGTQVPTGNPGLEDRQTTKSQCTLSLGQLFPAVSWDSARGGPSGFLLPSRVLHPSRGLMAVCPAEVEEFVIVPLHAEPSSAAEEIDALYDVYTDVVNKWSTNVSGSRELGSSLGQPGGLGYGHHASHQPSWDARVPRETSRTHRSGCHPGNVHAGSCWVVPLPLLGACPPVLRRPKVGSGKILGSPCCPVRSVGRDTARCPTEHPLPGRLQRRLLLRDQQPVAVHPPALPRRLRVAHS